MIIRTFLTSLLILSFIGSKSAAAMESIPCHLCALLEEESDTKIKSIGNWRGFSASSISMIQFQGNLEDYNASWGARDGLGLMTDNVAKSWRMEFNPFEKRQRILGEFVGLTTGVGFDWWHLGIDDRHRLHYEDASNSVIADALNPDSLQVSKNHIDAVYLRVPLLASLHTYKKGGNGFHLEMGLVAGYRLLSRYTFILKNSTSASASAIDLPVNLMQLHGRIAVGFGKMSILTEVSLLPFLMLMISGFLIN